METRADLGSSGWHRAAAVAVVASILSAAIAANANTHSAQVRALARERLRFRKVSRRGLGSIHLWPRNASDQPTSIRRVLADELGHLVLKLGHPTQERIRLRIETADGGIVEADVDPLQPDDPVLIMAVTSDAGLLPGAPGRCLPECGEIILLEPGFGSREPQIDTNGHESGWPSHLLESGRASSWLSAPLTHWMNGRACVSPYRFVCIRVHSWFNRFFQVETARRTP